MKAKENIANVKKSLRNGIRRIFVRDLYVEGQEPSKSYFGEKKFYLLYAIFLAYSFIILIGINYPGDYLTVLTFGNPFVFGNALIGFFLVLSILYSNDSIRKFIFEKRHNHNRFIG